MLGCVSTAIKAFTTPDEKILLHSPTYIGFTHVLENTGRVAELSKQVLSFKLSVKIFDVFGEKLDGGFTQNLYTASESDLDRQLRNADAKLGGFGFQNKYGKIYADLQNPAEYKVDCILYAADDGCLKN